MSKTFLVLLLLALAGGFFGYQYIHRDDDRLRMDNFQLRGQKTGLISDGTTVSSGEGIKLVLSLRGCEADFQGMCKATVRVNIEGPANSVHFKGAQRGAGGQVEIVDLNQLEPLVFRKNSAITSMEVTSEANPFPPGDYQVTVVAEDLVRNTKVENKVKFTSKS